jgi:anti-anti-sigma regulatory factor/GAF domain-containing protein
MSMTKDTPDFRAVTNFEEDAATVVLGGTFADTAASALDVILGAAIDRQPASMILDVNELDFLGAAGLLAISNAEKRLASSGVTLKIQSPSALVNRLLGIMESAESSRLDRAIPLHGHLGPEQLGIRGAPSQRFASSLSSADLRRVTALPADPDVIDGALRLVVELARISIRGADGVSVSLRRHGVLSTVAASDQTIRAMDADQYSTGQGPCVDASIKGHWFHAESLDTETRWPAFTPQARDLGIKAILSSPLRAFEKPVGALNIYSRTAESFGVKDQESAAAFAQQASVILSDARAEVSDTQMAIRFQEALRTRKVITLAEGIIMEREGIDENDALSALLRLALNQGIPLRERAEAMVRSAKQPELGPEWGLDD